MMFKNKMCVQGRCRSCASGVCTGLWTREQVGVRQDNLRRMTEPALKKAHTISMTLQVDVLARNVRRLGRAATSDATSARCSFERNRTFGPGHDAWGHRTSAPTDTDPSALQRFGAQETFRSLRMHRCTGARGVMHAQSAGRGRACARNRHNLARHSGQG